MGAAGLEIAEALRTIEPGDLQAATAVLATMTDAVARASDRLRNAARPSR